MNDTEPDETCGIEMCDDPAVDRELHGSEYRLCDMHFAAKVFDENGNDIEQLGDNLWWVPVVLTDKSFSYSVGIPLPETLSGEGHWDRLVEALCASMHRDFDDRRDGEVPPIEWFNTTRDIVDNGYHHPVGYAVASQLFSDGNGDFVTFGLFDTEMIYCDTDFTGSEVGGEV